MYVKQLMFFYYIPQQEEKVSFSFPQLFFRLNSEILFLLESPNHPDLFEHSTISRCRENLFVDYFLFLIKCAPF